MLGVFCCKIDIPVYLNTMISTHLYRLLKLTFYHKSSGNTYTNPKVFNLLTKLQLNHLVINLLKSVENPFYTLSRNFDQSVILADKLAKCTVKNVPKKEKSNMSAFYDCSSIKLPMLVRTSCHSIFS